MQGTIKIKNMQLAKLLSLILIVCYVMANITSAYADDSVSDRTIMFNPDEPATQSSTNSAKTFNVLKIPMATAGVIYGVTLGVGIRSCKYISEESYRMTTTLLDDFGGPGVWNMAMARAMGIPYGIASGSILGVIRGTQYGAKYGAEEPFSKKSIGLGEPVQISSAH